MRAALERWLLARWFGKPGLLWLLLPLEWLYRGVLLLRGAPTKEESAVPVIVVGNLAVGGSGKTPLVLALVAAARARGLQVGVIARGHGGGGPFPQRVTPASDARICGDEPLLIARRSHDVPVIVDPDRRRALAEAVAQGAELVISDDGLQHLRLPRTVEIAVIDGRRGLGNGHCLPVGPLREPAARLHSVDFVVGNGELLAEFVLPRAADATMALRLRTLHRVAQPTDELDLDAFRARCGAAVMPALAGIGDPPRFFAMLRALGFAIDEFPFPDHHDYTAADLAPFAGHTLLMTEKDAVKCGALVAAAGIDAWYLAVDAGLPADFAARVLARAGVADRSSA